jgi:DNA-binding MarR family transcriptional regulator
MTGGWRPFDYKDVWGGPVQVLERDAATDAILNAWRLAARFRRLSGRALREWHLTFAQWLVLVATERAVRVANDAVSQKGVALYLGIDEPSLSRLMAKLDKKAFVDIGPDAWGWSYRVIVTAKGRAVLDGAHRAIARVAATTLLGGMEVPSSEVDDGRAAEGLDGDLGEELGGGEDA